MASESTAIQKATSEIERVLEQCNSTALATMPMLTQAVTLATGMQQLRAALTDEVMNRVFMPLQSSPLGFMTDRDNPPWDATDEVKRNWKKGYPVEVVRDCLIEGMINGLRPVNNEINIIAKRAYAAKNGVTRKVREFKGLTDLDIVPGAPCMNEKGDNARVAIRAKWKLNGTPMELVRDTEKRQDGTVGDTRISIRVNKSMGADAILGKAIRKAYKAILDMLEGNTLSIGDADVIDTVGVEMAEPAPAPAPPEHDGKRMKIGATKPASSPSNGAPMREPGQEG